MLLLLVETKLVFGINNFNKKNVFFTKKIKSSVLFYFIKFNLDLRYSNEITDC